MATANKYNGAILIQQQKLKQQLQEQILQEEKSRKTSNASSISGQALIKMFQKQNQFQNSRSNAMLKTTFTKSRKDTLLSQVTQDPFSHTQNMNASNASLKKMLQKSASKAVLRSTIDNYYLKQFNAKTSDKKDKSLQSQENQPINIQQQSYKELQPEKHQQILSQIKSMQKLPRYQEEQQPFTAKKLQREQSSSSLSRQKSQAKMQTINTLGRESSTNHLFPDNICKTADTMGNSRKPAFFANCLSNLADLNIQNLKTGNQQCLSPQNKRNNDNSDCRHIQTGPVRIIRKENENVIFQSTQGQENKMGKKEALTRLVNLDKVRDLIRKSSKERRQETAKELRDSKDRFMTRTLTLLNLKKQVSHAQFTGLPDNKLTPIIMNQAEKVIPDDTLDDIKELLQSM